MRIALLGDVALFGRFSLGDGTTCHYFEQVADYLERFDLVVANLESPVGDGLRPGGAKSAYLSSRDEDYDLLGYLGIDAVNLANNHIFDFGEAGLDRTIEGLERRNIRYFGLHGPGDLIISGANAEIALIGTCAFNTNPLGVSSSGGDRHPIQAFDPKRLMGKLDAHCCAGRLPILSVHSGIEHVNYPSLEDIRVARSLAAGRKIVYYGHHPHVVQGVEQSGGSLLAYSLGNFCFDDVHSNGHILIEQSENNRTGMILELDVLGGEVNSFKCTGIYMGSDRLALDLSGFESVVADYSGALSLDEGVYAAMRDSLIREHLKQRRAKRNAHWYMQRMRPRYVEMLVRAKMNARRQKSLVGAFVNSAAPDL